TENRRGEVNGELSCGQNVFDFAKGVAAPGRTLPHPVPDWLSSDSGSVIRAYTRLVSRVGAAVRASSRQLFTISTGVLLGKLVVHLMCVAHPAVEVTMEILVHLAV